MGELAKLSISEAQRRLAKGDITAFELTEDCLKEAKNSTKLNAFCVITEELALKQAKAADQKINEKKNAKLTGIPIGIKDIFCTYGIKAQAASKILSGFIPPYESTVTKKL